MKRIMLISLAFFFPIYAEAAEAAEDEDAKNFSFASAATYSFLVNGSRIRPSQSTGASLSFAYALDSRSSLFLSTNGFANQADVLGSIGYKYWLTGLAKLRPWVQVAAGYLWNKSTANFPEPEHEGSQYTSDVQFSFGGGVRYELSKNLGLDASAVVFKAGAPWRWSNSSKLITTSLGADVVF